MLFTTILHHAAANCALDTLKIPLSLRVALSLADQLEVITPFGPRLIYPRHNPYIDTLLLP